MAITTDDFNKIWASTSPLTPYSFSASQYKEGWNFIGSTPPSRQMWDFLQKNNDEKMQYLLNHFDNYLPLSGGTLTGVVNGVTPTAGDNSTKIATTEFVNATAQQADWNVTDTTSKAFIKNKPSIKRSGSLNVSASLVINPTGEYYNEDMRMNESATGWATIYLGGSLNSLDGPAEHAWGIFRDPSYALGICPNGTSNRGKKGLYLPLNGRATLDGKTIMVEGDTVGKATADAAGNNIQTTYAKKSDLASSAPTGVVQAFAGSTIPTGWVLCDGSAVSRTTYASLYACIGTTYGTGNGSTTFNLPNLVDKFVEGSATAGTVKSAGLPNIVAGTITTQDWGGIETQMTGAWVETFHRKKVANVDGGTSADEFVFTFNASHSNSIYGNSTTVQPPALTMRYIIKY